MSSSFAQESDLRCPRCYARYMLDALEHERPDASFPYRAEYLQVTLEILASGELGFGTKFCDAHAEKVP